MDQQNLFEDLGHTSGPAPLSAQPPFIWPEARLHTGQAQYDSLPPTAELVAKADLISGVVVGAAEGTVTWLQEMLQRDETEWRTCLVLVLYPTSPTREEHLRAIHEVQEASDKRIEVRVLPMPWYFGTDCAHIGLPPTVIQAHCGTTGETVMSIGSVGDAGRDRILPGSFNLVFRPDDGVRDAWRKWFQFVLAISVPLSEETIQVPHLVPPEGQPEAALLWREFEAACRKTTSAEETAVKVNAETGEVESDADGKPVVPWDGGKTALDPLGQVLQKAYSDGWLVTVDEATRIKPLSIPVKAKLLGQESERVVGAVKQKQSFSLQVLGDDVNRAIEKCRKVTDLIDLLTFPLSQGNRWLPKSAHALLERELNARNERGWKLLFEAMGQKHETAEGSGDAPEQKPADVEAKRDWVRKFIAARSDKIKEDLNGMYRQLGQGDAVPADRLQSVLDEIETRLMQALTARITPCAVCNPIGAPDLTVTAPDENWNQPLSLLLRAAKTFRESLTDPYFRRRFSGFAFTEGEYTKACDVFGDTILSGRDWQRAEADLAILDEISTCETPAREKCHSVWSVIKGKHPHATGANQQGQAYR